MLSCPSGWPGLCAALPTSHHCQRRKWVFFFPSWQLLGRFTIVFWESSFSEAIVKTCSKQNFQPQDARRNGIQGGGSCQEWMWPLPHSVGMVQHFIPAVPLAHSPTRGTKVAIPDKPGNATAQKTAPGCAKQISFPSGKGRMDPSPRECQQISMNCCSWSPRITARKMMTTGEFGAEMLRELQFLSLLFGRACDVSLAKRSRLEKSR